MRVFLLRHGATDLSLPPPRMVGRTNPPLNEEGRRQAEALARRLEGEGISKVVASSLHRARETAEVIACHLRVPLEVDDNLREIDYGEWEGRLVDDLLRDSPQFKAFRSNPERVCPPGGESVAEVAERMWRALRRHAHGEGAVALVGHRTANRLLICKVLDAPLSKYRSLGQGLACLNLLEVDKGGVRIVIINDTCHLRE